MSVKIQYKGSDVDQAINLACEKLNVSREELEIDVISPGTAGFFGLCKKKAIIQASRKTDPSPFSSVQDESEPDLSLKKMMKKVAPANKRKKKSVKKLDSILEKADGALTKSYSPEVIAQIKKILLELLSLMGYQAEVVISQNNDKLIARIEGEHVESIIGREGSTLDAIQYLMRKIISQQFAERIFLTLDAGDYRESRKKELEALALEISGKVKETGKSRTIAALNPAERRIVHVVLQDDVTIRSSSIGDGLFKKIRIYLPGKGRKRPPRKPRGGKGRSGARRDRKE